MASERASGASFLMFAHAGCATGALKALMEQALAASGASKEEATLRASALSAIASLDEQRPGTLQRMLEQVTPNDSLCHLRKVRCL